MTSTTKAMTARDRDRLLEHHLAVKDIIAILHKTQENLIRCAYKPRLTERDQGKIYTALNQLACIASDQEANACKATLRAFKLRFEEGNI